MLTTDSQQLDLGLVPEACQWCDQPGTLLCDGRIAPGKTCDARMCQAHAKNVGWFHMRLSRRDKQGRRCVYDTQDLCPDCQARQAAAQ